MNEDTQDKPAPTETPAKETSPGPSPVKDESPASTPTLDAESRVMPRLDKKNEKKEGKRNMVVPAAVVAALAAVISSVFWLSNSAEGSLGEIVEPSNPGLTRVHAEIAGRGLAYVTQAESQKVAKKAVSTGPVEGVRYKIQSGGTLKDIARIFAMPLEDVKALNPRLSEETFIKPGRSVYVYKPGVALAGVDPKDREKLAAAVPISDGPGRRIRRRSRSWGTGYMVANLEKALTAYGEAYPEGPVVIVSDLSRREGGKLPPHHTHRNGRDVDLSYVPRPSQDNGGFMKMNSFAFDRDRNWTFIKAMLDTESVELILMDTLLQKFLYKHLEEKGMSKAELSKIFQYPRSPKSNVGIIRHWEGHRDHMHVRFACSPSDPYCR